MNIFDSANGEILKLDQYYPFSDLKHVYRINREKMVRIINTFDLIQTSNQITVENFKVIEEGLRENWYEIYFSQVGKYLAIIEPYYPEISTRLLALLSSKKYIIRRNIVDISILLKNNNLIRTILQSGIQDRSYKVFESALYKILRNYINDSELMALVKNKIILNNNPEKRKEYLSQVELHRQGYQISVDSDNRIGIEILIDRIDSTEFLSFSIPKEEFEKIVNMKQYIDEVRKKNHQ